jgi:PTS system nitrogen regulatory IIA component
MKLTVREISAMFDVPERTVERWIREDGMPGLKIHGQYRFHRAELLEWAHHRGIRIVTDPGSSQVPGHPAPTFAAALERGGVHRDLVATDRESLLHALIECLPIGADVDRDLVFDVFLARENAGSTGVGDGIAIPHVRSPIVLDVDEPSVSLCFLRTPVDFDAIDEKPVDTVFAIVAPTAREHLHLLGRLAGALHDPAFHRALLAREETGRLLELARAAEARLVTAPHPPRVPGFGELTDVARVEDDPVGDHQAARVADDKPAREDDEDDEADEPDADEVGA